MKCGVCKEGGVDIAHVRLCSQPKLFTQTEKTPQGSYDPATNTVTLTGQKPMHPKFDYSSVPEGRYAFDDADGTTRFYQVRKPTRGKWRGYTFVNLLVGSPGDYRRVQMPKHRRMEVLKQIAAGPQEAMAHFGHKSGNCGKCGAALSDEESLKRGVGPVCAETLGWKGAA